MSEMRIIQGPTKPELLWAIAYPERKIKVQFNTASEPIIATIERMDEQGTDGLTFALQGSISSGLLAGKAFKALYHTGEGTGTITLSP